MDDKVKALWDAAFHAWVTLGDLAAGQTVPKAEIRDAYARLQLAIEPLKAERGPPGSKRTRGAS